MVSSRGSSAAAGKMPSSLESHRNVGMCLAEPQERGHQSLSLLES